MRDDDAGPNVVPEDPPASELGGENSNPPGSDSPGHLPPGGLPGDERPAPTPVPPVPSEIADPWLGANVIYRLTAEEAEEVNRRRCVSENLAAWPGTQKHVGNPEFGGMERPAIVTAIWNNEYGDGVPGVNLQVFLDGNDTLWVTSKRQGPAAGQWRWPFVALFKSTSVGTTEGGIATPAHLGPGAAEPNPPGVPAPPIGVPDTSGPEI